MEEVLFYICGISSDDWGEMVYYICSALSDNEGEVLYETSGGLSDDGVCAVLHMWCIEQ